MQSPKGKDSAGKLVARAERYPIHAELQYRALGEKNWSIGSLENISASGMLFRGAHLLEPGIDVDLRFALPAKFDGNLGAKVVSRGTIVRSTLRKNGRSTAIMAAATFRSRLVPNHLRAREE
jgi:hypothetical protein